ncbi:hypothetical protein SAMN04488544_0667 [Microlunatus sagamiharensis]|uniref:Uncharacterized protein n=1 Tax=Microlunatus sagamiharensis TaxID=546874 RepID=A0A1H2LRW3_9ACTN|nr:hypothetical protein [Microlunatus sagamiharensis]SDU83331.1 hypothetical protein SAMN04488544_0667 [Microlunatus sagamiharensis]
MSTAINPADDERTEAGQTSGHQSRTVPVVTTHADRRAEADETVRLQKERFGGMKFGACFFGWLTATGTAVLLTALLGAAGAVFGFAQDGTVEQATENAGTIGLAGAIALLVVVLVAYLAGGYVAGRMARFNGLKQGLGVWLWAVVVAVVVAILGLIAGSRLNVLTNLNGVPRIPVNEGTLTLAGVITAVAVVVAALVGALIGGLAGMRFHRKVDRADLTAETGTTAR